MFIVYLGFQASVLVSSRRPRVLGLDGICTIELLERHVPPKHTAQAKIRLLVKLLCWNTAKSLQSGDVLAHQTDFMSMFLLNCEHKRQCGAGSQIN